jgi:hypothetical protein
VQIRDEAVKTLFLISVGRPQPGGDKARALMHGYIQHDLSRSEVGFARFPRNKNSAETALSQIGQRLHGCYGLGYVGIERRWPCRVRISRVRSRQELNIFQAGHHNGTTKRLVRDDRVIEPQRVDGAVTLEDKAAMLCLTEAALLEDLLRLGWQVGVVRVV